MCGQNMRYHKERRKFLETIALLENPSGTDLAENVRSVHRRMQIQSESSDVD